MGGFYISILRRGSIMKWSYLHYQIKRNGKRRGFSHSLSSTCWGVEWMSLWIFTVLGNSSAQFPCYCGGTFLGGEVSRISVHCYRKLQAVWPLFAAASSYKVIVSPLHSIKASITLLGWLPGAANCTQMHTTDVTQLLLRHGYTVNRLHIGFC